MFPVDCALKKAINQGISIKLIRKRVEYCPIINEKEREVEVELKNGKKAPLKKVEKKAKKVTAADINRKKKYCLNHFYLILIIFLKTSWRMGNCWKRKTGSIYKACIHIMFFARSSK